MDMSGKQSGRPGRRIPSGVPGINWVVEPTPSEPALSANLVNGQDVTLDQWQLGSAFALYNLWLGDGLLRLPAAGWELARDDVAHGFTWHVLVEVHGPDNVVQLTFVDTQATEPQQIELIDVAATSGGGVRSRHTVVRAPAVGLSGDNETDQHMAMLLCMLRQAGGVLQARASTLVGAAQAISLGHQWQAVLGENDGESQLFILSEPNGEAPPLP